MRWFRTALLLLALFPGAATAAPGSVLPSLFGGPFALIDHDGQAVTDRSFAGRHMLVYFGYTHCPDICPTDLPAIAAALDEIGGLAGRLHVLFITVDPARDTPERLRHYVTAIHPSIRGLTGPKDRIAAVATAYRVHRRIFRVEGADAAEYFMNHSSIAYLMGPDGAFLTLLPHGSAPGRIAVILRKYLAPPGR